MDIASLINTYAVFIRHNQNGISRLDPYAGDKTPEALFAHLAQQRRAHPEALLQAVAYYTTNCCEDLYLDLETGGYC